MLQSDQSPVAASSRTKKVLQVLAVIVPSALVAVGGFYAVNERMLSFTAPPSLKDMKDRRGALSSAGIAAVARKKRMTANRVLKGGSKDPGPVVQPTPRANPMPTMNPSRIPTLEPISPDSLPTNEPVDGDASNPTFSPTDEPSDLDLIRNPAGTYVPGDLTVFENGLVLSTGLKSKILAKSGWPVEYANGEESFENCHILPDFGATFRDTRESNKGGWVYTSNSEAQKKKTGGVGAFTFNSSGDLIDYRMILTETTGNCGGGRTPWGAWISCEEISKGQIWQVDPEGIRKPQVITLGKEGGYFESFAYDDRDLRIPRFFCTEDDHGGPLRRFTPTNPNWDDPWNILLGNGLTHYLLLYPDEGRFTWTPNYDDAYENAEEHYDYAEGIDCADGILYFVSKFRKVMFILDLDTGTYQSESTQHGAFSGQPDQIARVLHNEADMIFFTEDGGFLPGIHMRDATGKFFTLLESPEYEFDESTGVSLSPDFLHLYFAIQGIGLVFDVWREDGLPFSAKTLNIKHHGIGFEARHGYLEFP